MLVWAWLSSLSKRTCKACVLPAYRLCIAAVQDVALGHIDRNQAKRAGELRTLLSSLGPSFVSPACHIPLPVLPTWASPQSTPSAQLTSSCPPSTAQLPALFPSRGDAAGQDRAGPERTPRCVGVGGWKWTHCVLIAAEHSTWTLYGDRLGDNFGRAPLGLYPLAHSHTVAPAAVLFVA